MSTNLDNSRRASRLLRWYPTGWRERYGEEFVGHLEQEFAERPHDLNRTANVAYKGLVARIADVGLCEAQVNTETLTRAAVGTTFVLSALVGFIALAFWSRAMLLWNSIHRASVPDSVATGILTIATGLLLVVLMAMVVAVAIYVVHQFVRGRARPLVGPSIFAVGSGAFLIYSVRWLPTILIQYARGAHGIAGVRLSHPGQVIMALAEITWELTQRWIALWGLGVSSSPTVGAVVTDYVPFALLVFGIAVALLMRRVELPRVAERLGWAIVALLGALTVTFLVTYIAWIAVGGQSQVQPFAPEGFGTGVGYLVFLALAAVLIERSGMLTRRLRS